MSLEPSARNFAGPSRGPIVLYDGVCNLCDGAIRFILPRDPRGRFRFAALQGAFARELLAGQSVRIDDALESVILFQDGKVFQASGAMLRICRALRFPWCLIAMFLVVPRPIRDLAYKWIARNRYRWFGRSEACLLPRPEWRDRFLG